MPMHCVWLLNLFNLLESKRDTSFFFKPFMTLTSLKSSRQWSSRMSHNLDVSDDTLRTGFRLNVFGELYYTGDAGRMSQQPLPLYNSLPLSVSRIRDYNELHRCN